MDSAPHHKAPTSLPTGSEAPLCEQLGGGAILVESGPHRRAPLVRLCTECREPAKTACVRCGRPQCDEHTTTGDRRCAPCEADWAHREVALVKDTPEKIDAWRAYKLGVVAPSAGTAGLIASMLGMVAAFKGAIGGAVLIAAQAWLISFIFLTLLLTMPFFAVGTPLFARRKILELAQSVRQSSARQRFLSERAEPEAPRKATPPRTHRP